jgi:hypothetical protein
MHCTFNFRPVGQGGFFTAYFKKNNEQVLNMVYDCGTVSAGPHLMDQLGDARYHLRQTGGKQTIDMLVLSHFDEDHISGVRELLLNVKCRLLVIPFMTIFERLSVYAKKDAKAEWHRQLLVNPGAFFRDNDFDIDRIVMVDGNGEVFNDNFVAPILPLEPGSIPTGVPMPPRRLEDDVLTFDDQVVYMRLPFELEARDLGFFFKFYIQPFADALLTAFRREVIAGLPNINVQDLFEDKYRLAIKGIYHRVFGNINKTSLCLSIRRKSWSFIRYDDEPNMLFNYGPRQTGLLLTGDSFLKSPANRRDFLAYYQQEIRDTVLFQIPHHGSAANSELIRGSGLWDFGLFVMQHGHGRAKHPAPAVRRFLAAEGLNVHSVTQLQGQVWSYEIR